MEGGAAEELVSLRLSFHENELSESELEDKDFLVDSVTSFLEVSALSPDDVDTSLDFSEPG